MYLRRAPVAVALAVVALAASAVTVSAAPDRLSQTDAEESTQSYIVVLDWSAAGTSSQTGSDEVEPEEHAADAGVETKHVYEHALQGYSADLTDERVAELEADDEVAYVAEDVILHTQQSQPVPSGVRRIFGPENPNLGIGGADDVRVDADIAVIDSGVADHPDLDVVARVNCTGWFGGCSSGGTDDNGHGTHVAGTAAAINNVDGVVGVAPGARIHSAKVCGSTGGCSQSAIVAGIDWVTANADTIEVANMSLGGPGTSQPIADAVSASIASGVVYVVAAGNDGADARNYQPANHPDVVTVSALADSDGLPGGAGGSPSCRAESQDDQLADFSNWGPAVDIAAPGVCIESTWLGSGHNVISGTSMAAPHVTGAAAILTSSGNGPTDRAGVLEVRDALQASGNQDWTWQSRGAGDVQEPLLDIHDGTVFPPDGSSPPEGPVAAIDSSCDNATLTCDLDGSGSEGEIVEWSWDFGDGQSGNGQVVSHTYAEAGTYEAALTVTDADGLSDQHTATVQVGDAPGNQPPVAEFTASCTRYYFIWPGCQFDASGSLDADGEIVEWSWDFGDGTSSTEANPLKMYGFFGFGAAASYTVALTVTDDEGASATASQVVNLP
jgi:subtilisin family serine protease